MRSIPYLALLLIASMTSLACAQQKDLEAARMLWESHAIDDYSIDIRGINPLLVSPIVRLIVVDGQTRDVDVVPFDEPLPRGISSQPSLSPQDSIRSARYTIDILFALVDSSIVRGTLEEVEYNPEYGYPTRIYLDPLPDAIDDEMVISIRRFFVGTETRR